MTKIQLIVCENAGNWAAAIKKFLPPNLPLLETRSLPELTERLHDAPASVVAIELTELRGDVVLSALTDLAQEFSQAPVVILSERKLAAWEAIAREAGAIHFINSPRRLAELVDIVRRQAALVAERRLQSPQESAMLEEQILADLPWSDS